MRKLLFLAFAATMITAASYACVRPEENEPEDIKVTSIMLDKKEVTLLQGQSITLTATVSPDNATDPTVKWESSSPSVVSVDNNGVVTALQAGTSEITASAGTKKATCTITVQLSAQKYLTFSSEGTTTIALYNYGRTAPTLYYSNDKTTWTKWDYSAITFSSGSPLYICGKNLEGFSFNITSGAEKYSAFAASGDKFGISGDIMSLIDKDQDVYTIPTSDCFGLLFSFCSNLTYPPTLSATTLTPMCYAGMFYSCTSLTSAPELPATTLSSSCYLSMFEGCTNLTSAPDLPATTLAASCYDGLFYGCTSLMNAPALPATTLQDECYGYMFYNCTSLATAPALPATTLAPSCYEQMFCGCTSLAGAPELPATTLADECYEGMFEGCINLSSAPALPATSLADYCYVGMFENCTSLTSAPALPATSLTLMCYLSMFMGCSSLTEAPELPADNLVEYCYSGMFMDCKSLMRAPVLPAKTLSVGCYYGMFHGCNSLNYVKCLASDISAESSLTNWLADVASDGTFVKATNMTAWTSGPNGIPQGWSILSE